VISKIKRKLKIVLVMLGILSGAFLALNRAVCGKDTVATEPAKAEYNLDRFKEEMSLFEKATDRETKIEHLRKALTYRPKHPNNIILEYHLAVETAHITDPQTHEYIRIDEARQIYEEIVNKYNHMDYYSTELLGHPRSPQIIVPECAIAAGVYQKDQAKAKEYYYKAMECLNQTYQRREKDWQTEPVPEKPLEDSPFGGPRELGKWESRVFMWQRHKSDAERGDVLHEIELRLIKRAVQLYLLGCLSEYGDRNYPTFNQDKVTKAMMKIIKDFPDTPIADYASEYGHIIVNVLDKLHLATK